MYLQRSPAGNPCEGHSTAKEDFCLSILVPMILPKNVNFSRIDFARFITLNVNNHGNAVEYGNRIGIVEIIKQYRIQIFDPSIQ